MRAVVLLIPVAALIAALGALVWLFAFDREAAPRRPDAVAATAPASAPGLAQSPRESMRVGGVVLSSGKPVEGAQVEVWPEENPGATPLATTTSDGLGRFLLNVPRRKLRVVASIPRSAPSWQRVEHTTETLRLELVGGVVARGVLLSESARPIAGATVEKLDTTPPLRRVTDERGRFDLPPLDPRHAYYFVARARGFAARRFAVALDGQRRVRYVLRAGSTLAGTVRDSTGASVADVTVVVQTNDMPREDRSDENGRYRIEGIPIGFPGAIELRRTGHLPQPCRAPVAYARAGAVLEFDPIIQDGVTLAGTAGPGATVVLMRFSRTNVKKWGSTACDASGRFRFDAVTPGAYLLHPYPWASLGQHQRRSTRPDRVFVDVHDQDRSDLRIEMPATADVVVKVSRSHAGKSVRLRARMEDYEPIDAQGHARFVARPVTPRAYAWFKGMRQDFPITEGEPVTIAFADPPQPRAILTGVVATPDGRPLPGARVRLTKEQGRYSWRHKLTATTDLEGRFEIKLGTKDIAESWAVLATHPEHVTGFVRGVKIGADARPNIRIAMRRGLVLEGSVVDANGRASAGATVVLDDEEYDDPRWVSSHSDRTTIGELLEQDRLLETLRTRSDAEGRFRFTRCTSARCFVRAWANGAGSQDIEVKAGGEPVRLQLKRGPHHRIGGIILDETGEPVFRAYIKLPGTEIDAVTQPDGRFTLEEVPAGRHDVEIGARWGSDRPRFQEQIVKAVEAGKLDLIVRVQPGPTLKGRVVGPDGQPVPRPEVFLFANPKHRSTFPMGTTKGDDAGRFEVRGIDSDAAELGVFARGFLPRLFPVQTGEAEFRLQRGLSIGGHLLTAAGKPARNLWLRFQLKKPVDPNDVAAWKRKGQSYLPYFRAQTNEQGHFRLTGLVAGEYRLREPKDVPAISVTAGSTNLELRQRALLTVSGYVVDEHGQPATSDGKSRLYVAARFGNRYAGSATVEDDGSFRLEKVPQGKIQLRVNGYPRFKSTSITVPAGSENVRIQLGVGQFREKR